MQAIDKLSELSSPDLKDVAEAVKILARRPDIRRAWLFGSAGCGRPLDWRSDLDFAVEGLHPGGEYSLWAELDEVVKRPVDLVRLEDSSDLLHAEILKGQVIYEN